MLEAGIREISVILNYVSMILKNVFNSHKYNYVSFNGSMTPYGSNVYTNPNMEIISPSRNVLGLGIYMSGDCTFNYHISSLSKKCANLSGWILRTFYTRNCITMLILLKAIVLSRFDYGSRLWSPFLIKHITQLEKIQRSFTKHITGMNDMPYQEWLKSLGLYSLQRRRERYCIIYIWKIIEGLAPNFSNHVTSTVSGRRGRSCVISHVNVGHVGTLAYNSFRWRSIRLFNSLPMHLRVISSCSVLRFKTQLHILLGSVEDLPCLTGFNNSLDGGDCRWRSPRDGLATN